VSDSEPSGPAAPARLLREPALSPPLGQFHELTLSTPDIRGSVEFYERLGFTQALTGDVWPHPYGVLTDGDIVLGLHQDAAREASVTWVRAGVARLAASLERDGHVLDYRRTGAEEFHEIGLRDPAGHLIRVLEARTYSPPPSEALAPTLCGEFAALALHCRDFAAAKRFWEPLGFVALEERDSPFEHLALTSDHLDLVLHGVRSLGELALIFTPDASGQSSLAQRLARLRAAQFEPLSRLPAALDPAASALIESPEGTRLLLLAAAF
jgi:catechol 2,3-dioxygenase-like lactoylglutathione lyase family enzyme